MITKVPHTSKWIYTLSLSQVFGCCRHTVYCVFSFNWQLHCVLRVVASCTTSSLFERSHHTIQSCGDWSWNQLWSNHCRIGFKDISSPIWVRLKNFIFSTCTFCILNLQHSIPLSWYDTINCFLLCVVCKYIIAVFSYNYWWCFKTSCLS